MAAVPGARTGTPRERAVLTPTTLLAVLLSSVLLGGVAPVALADGEDHHFLKHRFVRIRDGSLYPKVQPVGTHEATGWVNSSGKVAVVSFSAETARKMFCKSLNHFRINGDRLESGPIQARQFASLCRLAPGRYAYRVVLREEAGDSSLAPLREFAGTIIVE